MATFPEQSQTGATTIAPARRRPSLQRWIRDWLGHRQFRDVGPLRVERVDLPGAERSLQIRRPYPEVRDSDEYLPHWAEIWPAGVVLAGFVAREPWRLAGKRVLEIGPGVGVTAVAAMQTGAELIVVDYAIGSLALTALNARHLVGREPETVAVNWREPTPQFFSAVGEGVAVVLGADMLYENRDVKPLARLLERILATDGEVWIAEPGREAAERLVERLRERGWSGPTEECASPLPDPQDGSWDVMRVHRLRRPMSGRVQPHRR